VSSSFQTTVGPVLPVSLTVIPRWIPHVSSLPHPRAIHSSYTIARSQNIANASPHFLGWNPRDRHQVSTISIHVRTPCLCLHRMVGHSNLNRYPMFTYIPRQRLPLHHTRVWRWAKTRRSRALLAFQNAMAGLWHNPILSLRPNSTTSSEDTKTIARRKDAIPNHVGTCHLPPPAAYEAGVCFVYDPTQNPHPPDLSPPAFFGCLLVINVQKPAD
jgi:hypothetical protein